MTSRLSILAMVLPIIASCSGNTSKNDIDLSGKRVGEIRTLYNVGEKNLMFVGHPPCVLNVIGFKIDNSDYFLFFGAYGADYKLRFNSKKPCDWDILDFDPHIPDEIYMKKNGSNKKLEFNPNLAPLK